MPSLPTSKLRGERAEEADESGCHPGISGATHEDSRGDHKGSIRDWSNEVIHSAREVAYPRLPGKNSYEFDNRPTHAIHYSQFTFFSLRLIIPFSHQFASCQKSSFPTFRLFHSWRLQGPHFNPGVQIRHTIIVFCIQALLEQFQRSRFIPSQLSLHRGIK